MQTSGSETNVEVDILDIVPSSKIKIGGKRVPVNVPVSPLDNVSFHSEGSMQNGSMYAKEELLLKES